MSIFNLKASIEQANRRLGNRPFSTRRPRSDRGQMRLLPEVKKALLRAMGGRDRLPLDQVLAALETRLRRQGLRPPSRATVYNFLKRAKTPIYIVNDLPTAVQAALYNLDAVGSVPARQLAFYCFNYGSTEAMMFAAAMPWLPLYQAARMAGFRPRSRGLLEAVLRARKI